MAFPRQTPANPAPYTCLRVSPSWCAEEKALRVQSEECIVASGEERKEVGAAPRTPETTGIVRAFLHAWAGRGLGCNARAEAWTNQEGLSHAALKRGKHCAHTWEVMRMKMLGYAFAEMNEMEFMPWQCCSTHGQPVCGDSVELVLGFMV